MDRLNFWRCLNSFVFAFVFVMLFAGVASGLKFGVAPSSMNLNGMAGENICGKVNLDSDREISVSVDELWKNDSVESRRIQDYNMNGSDLGIIRNYEKSFKMNAAKEEEICFRVKNPGIYTGALIFNAENGYASVGVWVVLNVTERKSYLPDIGGITGNAVNSIKGVVGKISLLTSVIVMSFIFELVLLLLLIKLGRKKRKMMDEMKDESEDDVEDEDFLPKKRKKK